MKKARCHPMIHHVTIFLFNWKVKDVGYGLAKFNFKGKTGVFDSAS
jgi:hypothetical protein